MGEDAPTEDLFPKIPSRDVEVLVTQCSDVTLQVSASQVIETIYCASAADRARFAVWIGARLEAIIAKDSLHKLTNLLSDNAFSPECEGNWRHLNFRLGDEESIPLLLKYFEFGEADQRTRLICARDLTGQLQIQRLLQEELVRLEHDREALFSTRGR